MRLKPAHLNVTGHSDAISFKRMLTLIHEAVGASDMIINMAPGVRRLAAAVKNGCLLNSVWMIYHLDKRPDSCSESKVQNPRT